MNNLLEKFNEFKSITNFRFVFELEDGTILEFKLKQTDFPHLIGLHKLNDLPIIRKFNDPSNLTVGAKYLISKIKKETILTESSVKGSRHFSDIEDRYRNFSKDNLLTVSYTDAIVNFNPSLINSQLHSDYILFENRDGGYNHLCVALGGDGKRYAESYFHNSSTLYMAGQCIVKIKKVMIYDSQNNLYLEDTLL